MRARRWLVSILLGLGVAMPTTACRPRLFAALDHGPASAWDVWQEMRLAHTGGRRVQAMRFLCEESWDAGASAFLYPELGPYWVSQVRLDFGRDRAWQVVSRDGTRLQWELDGATGRVLRNNREHAPRVGADRPAHLRTLMRLLRPWEVVDPAAAEVVLLPTHGETLDIEVRQRGDGERWHVEVDADTGFVVAVRYLVRAGPLPLTIRATYHDVRDVGGGIRVPHRIHEEILTATGPLPFHDMVLQDVDVELEPAFPVVTQPRFPGPPSVQGTFAPTPRRTPPAGAER